MADDGTSPLAVATGFNWDDGNAPKAVDRHGVEPGECEQAFFLEPFGAPCWSAGGALSVRRRPAVDSSSCLRCEAP
jgi:hypothetical protein